MIVIAELYHNYNRPNLNPQLFLPLLFDVNMNNNIISIFLIRENDFYLSFIRIHVSYATYNKTKFKQKMR